jgi:broad specificity phosphatase PhoE
MSGSPPPEGRVLLVRHGETEWSRSGRHTGTTDLPLTEEGRRAAERLRPLLAERPFALVLSSPRRRARETCELAGFGDLMRIDPDLVEWEYGEYEGLTTAEIRRKVPEWNLFEDGCPGGESPEQVGARADRLLERVRAAGGVVALFAHGHFSRVLAARWIGLPTSHGRNFLLDTATVSVLGMDREDPAIRRWNAPFLDGRTAP